ncbi:MAG TPA: thiamine ABC transporter substrate-binding protein [Chloroflexi bacterium]|nr:thiamine ABC transporter substrate-binding protein [Chloroflexota bacterium]
MKQVKCLMSCVLVGMLMLSGCRSADSPIPPPTTPTSLASPPPRVVRMMTHDSFDISAETIAVFEAAYHAQVEILQAGDTGVMLNQAILSRDHPLADVLYGVDNTLLSRALAGDIFEAYNSPLLSHIPNQLILDPQHHALPVDYGDVCLNYDRGWFAEQGLTPPANLEDLVKPEYAGLTVVENPATSSPGLAFLLATIGHWGESGSYTYLDYWTDLRKNGLLVVEGWEDAYWGQFTHGSGGEGDRPIVVSYASSPPVEVHFAEQPFEEAPTAAVVGAGSCFRQIEFVGILKGAQNRELAQAWVDFMLDRTFQEDIPLHMFMFPANREAVLPEVFAQFAVIPEWPAEVDYAAIEANRETWVQAWTEVVLR